MNVMIIPNPTPRTSVGRMIKSIKCPTFVVPMNIGRMNIVGECQLKGNGYIPTTPPAFVILIPLIELSTLGAVVAFYIVAYPLDGNLNVNGLNRREIPYSVASKIMHERAMGRRAIERVLWTMQCKVPVRNLTGTYPNVTAKLPLFHIAKVMT
jgi:hypothetical protein